jgi:ATP-binding cassette, subfamily B, bacterial
MFGFMRPVKLRIFLACLYLSLWIGAEVLAVRQTARAIDQIKTVQFTRAQAAAGFLAWVRGDTSDATGLRHIVLILAGFMVIMGLLVYLREVANARMSMEMVYYIREAVYDQLQRVGFAFHDAISTGELINRSLSDLQNVRSFINSAVLISLEILLIIGGYFGLLLCRSTPVALLALLPLPFWIWYVLRFSRKMQPALVSVMESGDRNVSIITENIAGVHVVKAFATERQEIAKYQANCDEFFTRVMRRIRLYANFAPVMRAISLASHLMMFCTAGVLIIKGRLDAGDVLMLGAAMGAILNRLQQVSTINDQYQNAIVSARRLHEVLAAPPTVAIRDVARPLPPGLGRVRFEGVTFGYNSGKAILHDVSFEVPGGSVVAIVGPTGAGKSTLANLIGRFYDPQQGRVLIDGADVRHTDLGNLRRQVAYVFQETYLFSDTVEANIAYGRPGIDMGHVEAAARLSQAHEFIERLPAGYQTVLSERGGSLSGGQRQRLAIARAVVTNPRILVLDDATAAVDPGTEDLIQRAMRFVMTDRTTFVIAHRVSTVKRADLVIVLENGRITQMGTHEELMRQPGHYRHIAEVQLLGGSSVRADEDSPSHLKRMGDGRGIAAIAAAAREKEEE